MVQPGYKQTEIGVIPHNWTIKYLSDFGRVQSGGTPSTSSPDYWDGDIPWCTPSDITRAPTKYINSTERTITEAGLNNSSAIVMPAGSILLCTRATIGELKINSIPMATNQGFKNIAIGDNGNAEFFYYLLQTKKNSMLELAIGSTFLEISKTALCKIPLQIPTRDEQNRIAEALSTIDELITILEKQISKRTVTKQGAIQELLTGKKRLPGFSGEWSDYLLGDLGVFIKGSGISRAESNSGRIPAVRYGELYTAHQNYVTHFVSHISKEVAAKAKQVYKGDILFAASGETKTEIGKCAAIIDDQTVYAGGDILIFRPHEPHNPVFMGTLLNTAEVCRQRAEKGQGDAVVHIHADSLGSIKIKMPEIKEQDAIAEILLGMDKEIEILEKKLEKYRQIKQGMMQQLLTGKIRLV